ncbi:MAG: hypothetical protein CMJ83_14480 [Planctomycetes bacterium]|nr:hypothetical protein [Planctomycetota bacterium]
MSSETDGNQERLWLERRLRAAVLAGDDTAWEVLVNRAFDAVLATVRAVCHGDDHVVDEVVQETWMVAVRRMRDFDPDRAPFTAWVRGIARRRVKERAPAELPIASVEPDAVAEPMVAADVSERISLAMAGLPVAYQEVIRAKYLDRLTVDEISRRVGATRKAVESRLSRARLAFRRAFSEL